MLRRLLWLWWIPGFCFLLGQALFSFSHVQATHSNDKTYTTPRTLAMLSTSPTLSEGALLYAENCAVCHGPTGLGFEEAKEAFPPDEQRCTRCHKPSNSRYINWNNIVDNNMFDVGVAPALRGVQVIPGLRDPTVLAIYLEATMPRYEPGRLSSQEYQLLADYLLTLESPAQ